MSKFKVGDVVHIINHPQILAKLRSQAAVVVEYGIGDSVVRLKFFDTALNGPKDGRWVDRAIVRELVSDD